MTTLNLYSKDQVDALLPDSDELVPDTTGASQGDVLTVGASGTEWTTPSGGTPASVEFTTMNDLCFYMSKMKPGDTMLITGHFVSNQSATTTDYYIDGDIYIIKICEPQTNFGTGGVVKFMATVSPTTKVRWGSVTSAIGSYDVTNVVVSGYRKTNGDVYFSIISRFKQSDNTTTTYGSLEIVSSNMTYNALTTLTRGCATFMDGVIPSNS